MKKFIAIAIFLSAFCSVYAQWPTYLDLNTGGRCSFRMKVNGKTQKFDLRLDSIQYTWSPNLWHKIPEDSGKATLVEARLYIRLNGEAITLLQRPYQLPVIHGGLRLYVENTRVWAERANFQGIKNLPAEARVSATPATAGWGPGTLRFPIREYRWRSAAYNNSWSSVVPYNSLYYHRGEDYGAIPDRLSVQAVLGGTISSTLLPDGDGLSNAIVVRHDDKFSFRYAHMNTAHVDQRMTQGAYVAVGQVMAKTGDTYRRPGAQFRDPHLHVNFIIGDQAVSTYPYLVEAYLRDYPDTVLAVAGGYLFTVPGQPVELDASRSIIRPGHKLSSFKWTLPDGSVQEQAIVKTSFLEPGLFTAELEVASEDGARDRDFVQIRVYDKGNTKDIPYGWAYHSPVRGLKAGAPVLIWKRLVQTDGPVLIDLGDGTPVREMGKELEHRYAKPGLYTVSLTGKGTQGDPITVKMKIVVEP